MPEGPEVETVWRELSQLINQTVKKTLPIENIENVTFSPRKVMVNIPVEQLTLSVRTMNCLRRGNIKTMGEIISTGEKGLRNLRNFGRKSLQEIEERLNGLGLSLYPKVEEEEEEPAEDEPPQEAEAVDSAAGSIQSESLSGTELETGESQDTEW